MESIVVLFSAFTQTDGIEFRTIFVERLMRVCVAIFYTCVHNVIYKQQTVCLLSQEHCASSHLHCVSACEYKHIVCVDTVVAFNFG